MKWIVFFDNRDSLEAKYILEEMCLSFFPFNGISTFLGNLMCKSSLQKWYYWTNNWENKTVHTFPKGFSLEVNVIARLELEPAYYNFAVQHVSHCATETPLNYLHGQKLF